MVDLRLCFEMGSTFFKAILNKYKKTIPLPIHSHAYLYYTTSYMYKSLNMLVNSVSSLKVLFYLPSLI